MNEEFRVLRMMAVVFKVFAWFALIAGVAVSIFALVASSVIAQQLGTAGVAGGGFVAFIGLMIYSLFVFGSLYALAQGIQLLFKIERQSRPVEDQMQDMRKAA